MNSFERVMNRLSGKPVDRLPNMGLTMMFAAKEIGVTFGEYCSNYRALAEGSLRCHEKYGIDMVCAISDPMREAEGLGAKVEVPEDAVPFSPVKRIQQLSDIDTLKVIDPSMGRRMADRVEAVRLMKEWVKDEVPVVGWIEGAVAESCDLMDMQEFFMNLYDEPEEVKRLVKELHDLWMRYYGELCEILEECAQGYSDWSKIFSSQRSYIIQSDFSFMISNPMFQETPGQPIESTPAQCGAMGPGRCLPGSVSLAGGVR